jgi:hypothetical protein
MAHKFNMTVPGVVGYKPQKAGSSAQFFNPTESLGNDPLTGSDIRDRYSPGSSWEID